MQSSEDSQTDGEIGVTGGESSSGVTPYVSPECADDGEAPAQVSCVELTLADDRPQLLLEHHRSGLFPIAFTHRIHPPALCERALTFDLLCRSTGEYFHFYCASPARESVESHFNGDTPLLLAEKILRDLKLPVLQESRLPLIAPELNGAGSQNGHYSPQHEAVESKGLERKDDELVADPPAQEETPPIPDVNALIGEHLEHLLSRRVNGAELPESDIISEEEPENNSTPSSQTSQEIEPFHTSAASSIEAAQTEEQSSLLTSNKEESLSRAPGEGFSEIRRQYAEVEGDFSFHSPQEQSEPEPEDDGTSLSQQDAEIEISTYRRYAQEEEWTELLQLCERRFHDTDKEDYEARLWWLKAQLVQRLVPVSMLSAPVDTITREVLVERCLSKDDLGEGKVAELESLAVGLLVEVSDEFSEIKKYQSALPYLQRAEQIDNDLAPSLLELTELAIEKQEGIPEYERTEAQHRSLKALYSSKSELELRIVPQEIPEEISEPDLEKERGELDPLQEAIAQSEELKPARSGRRAIRTFFEAACMLLILALAGHQLWQQLGSTASQEEFSAFEVSEIAMQKPNLLPAPIERIASLGHLDALLYDIDKSGKQAALVSPAGVTNSISHPSMRPGNVQASAGMSPVSVVQPVKTAPKAARDVVNTSTPVEPEAVRRLLLSPAPAPKRKSIGPGYVKGFPGKDSSSASNSVAPSYPVYRYSPPRTYNVVVNTKVLGRPSYTSAVRAELKKDSRVEVEEDLTLWLKIRSRGGRVGYILAQDATPVD